MRSMELTKLRHRSAPQESSRVPKSPHRSARPKGGIGFDDADDDLLDSVCASGDDVFSLAGRMASTHSPARPGPDNPTRRIARTRFSPGNERRRLSLSSHRRPDPTRPDPPLSSALGGFLLGRLAALQFLTLDS